MRVAAAGRKASGELERAQGPAGARAEPQSTDARHCECTRPDFFRYRASRHPLEFSRSKTICSIPTSSSSRRSKYAVYTNEFSFFFFNRFDPPREGRDNDLDPTGSRICIGRKHGRRGKRSMSRDATLSAGTISHARWIPATSGRCRLSSIVIRCGSSGAR